MPSYNWEKGKIQFSSNIGLYIEEMKKYSYLYRLIAIMILSLLLPVVLFFLFFWKKSFEELERNNAIYYEEVLQNFRNTFVQHLQNMEAHALEIVVDSRDAKSAFWEGTSLFQKSDYYRYAAVKEIQDKYIHQTNSIGLEGIYFYSQDYVITNVHAISTERYKNDLNAIEDNEKLSSFFAIEHFENAKMIMAPVRTENGSNDILLVGFCVKLGRGGQDNALIIYKIDQTMYSAGDSIFPYENLDVNFYIMDKENLEVYFALEDEKKPKEQVNWEIDKRKVGGVEQTVAFRTEDDVMNLAFGIQVASGALQNSIFDFYQNMRLLVFGVSFLMLCICVGSIIVVYKPIYRLSSDLEDYPGGEIEMIQNALDDRRLKIMEQEMLVYDLLLNHLIYGVPISEKAIRHLGVKKDVCCYTIFIIEGHVLLNREIQILSKEIEERFQIKILVTDWREKKSSIIISFLKENNVSCVEAWLKQYLQDYFEENFSLYSGKVVNQINDIRESFLSCLEVKNRNTTDSREVKSDIESFKAQDKKQKEMIEDIIAFINIHYRETEFCQSTVADEFGITNYALSRMFKKHMGIGFTEYVNSKRIEVAKEILLTTSETVKEVSLMVGFLNHNYFSRLFKTTVGISASDFRNK